MLLTQFKLKIALQKIEKDLMTMMLLLKTNGQINVEKFQKILNRLGKVLKLYSDLSLRTIVFI